MVLDLIIEQAKVLSRHQWSCLKKRFACQFGRRNYSFANMRDAATVVLDQVRKDPVQPSLSLSANRSFSNCHPYHTACLRETSSSPLFKHWHRRT